MHTVFQNKDDFQELYKTYFSGLVNFVHARYINDRSEARDVVQTTFLKIWKNREKINISTSVKSYLFQAVKNTAFDHIRKNSKISHLDEDQIKNLEETPNEIEEETIESYRIKVLIKQGLELVKPKSRKIFELNKFEGLTYQEIADHMQISKRSVEDNMARTLNFLKSHMREVLNSEF